jgi:hypothetical protein
MEEGRIRPEKASLLEGIRDYLRYLLKVYKQA